MLQASREGAEPERRNLPDRLEHDAPAHLRAAALAVDECDRHLEHAEAGPQRAVRGLDLEGVAAGADCAEVDSLEDLPAVALEAARQIADGHAEQYPRVQRPARRD